VLTGTMHVTMETLYCLFYAAGCRACSGRVLVDFPAHINHESM